ncbi:arf-GAP with Rho-GAP domain, ANK repeat and PH domain-containing protein 1 isoform X1 [Scleropages formosus]|uniref:Arf-GAP with Rho-GAP domain, ANK repeat and PH domain-containing protein 1-like n=2 Tax=Scleropages formosus TaxID=113540 RepID=A0A8C9V9F9_SCLFO|nr:arf-GAP with Rho-GAP domain, ANK repeat and PH domain-containing protein 1-like isoform X1 [Scleropages formosus]
MSHTVTVSEASIFFPKEATYSGRCDSLRMSGPTDTVQVPIPKPRQRQRLVSHTQSSSERAMVNNAPDSQLTENHPEPQGSHKLVKPGAPPAFEGEGDTSALISNGSSDGLQNSPAFEAKDTARLINNRNDKPVSVLSKPPGSDGSSSLPPHQNTSLPLSAQRDRLTSSNQNQLDTNDFRLETDRPIATSGSPPLESLGTILKDLADWATDPGYDSSTEEEIAELPSRSAVSEKPCNTNDSGNKVHVLSNIQPSELRKENSALQTRPLRQMAPRVATIRVSRRKQTPSGSSVGSQAGEVNVVSRSSWLDVWQGRKHHVLWVTLDGQMMSLWKKRTDKFTEVVFHVSSITSIQKQDRAHFSIYFNKKRIEFMADTPMAQESWIESLHACRGQVPPAPAEQHGPLQMKDPRSKVYVAICGHSLWIHRSKEDFSLGVGMNIVSMDMATVKQTGRHSFSLITPYRTFNFTADSSKDLLMWQESLMRVIRSALSCSEVAQRLWSSPWNKVCADCGSPNPEWASINLVVLICEACAGQHRSVGINVSKVRSLKMDSKVWTNPLIQLFVLYGNKVANSVWGHNMPIAEQILPDASPNQRNAFIKAKYCKGLYRRPHPLAFSQKRLNQRLCEVVCSPDVSETMMLVWSGAQILCHTEDPQLTSPILLAEQASQALQVEFLKHNEFIEVPRCIQKKPSKRLVSQNSATTDPNSAAAGQEELHGKLEEDRFLFSQENDSAACDVLDLREVTSIFDCSSGPKNEFEMLTLADKLICSSDTRDGLLAHLTHILKVVLPGSVSDEDLQGVHAVSRVWLREGEDLRHTEVWVALRNNEILIYPIEGGNQDKMLLTPDMCSNMDATENTIEVVTATRTICLQFEQEEPCQCWGVLMKVALPPEEKPSKEPRYQLPSFITGRVPPGLERCISHITQYGLKVEGIYRRCGMAVKVSELVEILSSSPSKAQLVPHEMGVLDVAGALKQFIRQKLDLIPASHMGNWVQAAGQAEEAQRLKAYRTLLNQLPPDNRITLSAVFGHLYIVQLYSQQNKMTAQNLAIVFVPNIFQQFAMNTDMVRLTRELIVNYTAVFQEENNDGTREEEMLTFF